MIYGGGYSKDTQELACRHGLLSIFNKNPKKNEIIVPTLTWVSDIASVIQNNLDFKF